MSKKFRKGVFKDSFILSCSCVVIVRGKKQYGTLYLDSLTKLQPTKESVAAILSRLARVMLEALLRDEKISVPKVSATDYLTSHSFRDLEREPLLTVSKWNDWNVFSASQELGTKLRVLYSQMERLGIEPAQTARTGNGASAESFSRGLLQLEVVNLDGIVSHSFQSASSGIYLLRAPLLAIVLNKKYQ